MREQTLAHVRHPDPMTEPLTGRALTLIEDPLVDKITKGDPTLGWEGDERLALYLDPLGKVWQLWRLEFDGVYRAVMILDATKVRATDVVGRIVMSLVETDTRRGFDPLKAVFEAEEKRKRAREAADAEHYEEAAKVLDFALRKDGI